MKNFYAVGFAFLLTLGCSGSDDDKGPSTPPAGTEGQACYPNGTCDTGLSCLSKLCVAAEQGGTGGTGSSAGSAPVPAGSPSAGAPSAGAAGGGGQAPVGGTSGASEPSCRTIDVTNATAGEKVNAALCFGIGNDDAYSCTYYDAPDETRCLGSNSAYVVVYMQTNNGTVGDIYDLSDGEHIGIVIQGPTGSFDFTLDGGETGSCMVNGDVATLCVNP